jgi:hypothetical protein
METTTESNERRVESRSPDSTWEMLCLDPASIPSPVIARLIEEVRNEEPSMLRNYNRFHNRHNR